MEGATSGSTLRTKGEVDGQRAYGNCVRCTSQAFHCKITGEHGTIRQLLSSTASTILSHLTSRSTLFLTDCVPHDILSAKSLFESTRAAKQDFVAITLQSLQLHFDPSISESQTCRAT